MIYISIKYNSYMYLYIDRYLTDSETLIGAIQKKVVKFCKIKCTGNLFSFK